jgi:hypothetical protein
MTQYRVRPPTRVQELALAAALAMPEEARAAWTEQLGGAAEIPALDAGSFRLLPLIYRNLGADGNDVPAGNILRGIYRQAWYRNQVAGAALAGVIGELQAVGIESMLLKGWAVVELGYKEPGTRPMNDADFLVRPKHFERACEVLIANGFEPVSGVGRSQKGRRTFHAVAFRNATGIDVDLHHHMLEECCWNHADAGVWERSSSQAFGTTTVSVPSREDLLINLCVHGVRWDPVPPLRWIADAVTLIRARELDWGLVAAESARRGVSIAMEAALSEVSRFEPVPGDVLEALGRSKRGALERLDFRAQQSPDSMPGMVTRYLTRYLRLTARRGVAVRGIAFPVYLQGMWELDTARQVPAEGLRRVLARLRGRQPVRGLQRAEAPSEGKISA